MARALVALGPSVPTLGRFFADAGHELALVGGSVRDMALDRQWLDLDLTTDAHPDVTERLLGSGRTRPGTSGRRSAPSAPARATRRSR